MTDIGAGEGPARRDALSGSCPWTTREVVWVAAVTGLVLVAACWRLGRQSLSGDEAATWAISGHSLAALGRVLRSSGGDRAAGLYYVAVFGWVHIFGTTTTALRALSVVAATATLVPFHAVSRRLGPIRSVAADVLFAASPFFLTYARDARAYALVTLLVVLASWRFLRAVETDRAQDWMLYGTLAVLAAYTQWFAILVVVAHFVTLTLTREKQNWTPRARTTAAGLVVAAAPIGVLIATGQTSGISWIAPLSATQLRLAFGAITGSAAPFTELAVGAVLAIGGFAVAGLTCRGQESPTARRTAVLAVTWFFVPLLVTVAVSIAEPVLVARYLIVALPGYALLAAVGLAWLTRKRAALTAVAVGVILALGSPGYGQIWAQRRADEDWRGVVATIERRAGPTDAVIVFPESARFGFAYYARDEPGLRRRGGALWPPGPWDEPFAHSAADPRTAVAAVQHLHASVVWLVVRDPGGPTVRASTAHPPALRGIRRALARDFSSTETVAPFTPRHTLSVVRYSTTSRQ
jgi:mannosyltransferase